LKKVKKLPRMTKIIKQNVLILFCLQFCDVFSLYNLQFLLVWVKSYFLLPGAGFSFSYATVVTY